MAADLQHIAIFSSGELIGDGLFKLPVLRAARALYPQAHISWVTQNATVYASTLRPIAEQYVSSIHEKTRIGSHTAHLIWPPHSPVGPLDLLIDTQTVVIRSLIARRTLRPHTFISGAGNFLLSSVKPPSGYRRPPHLIDRLTDLVRLGTNAQASAPLSAVPLLDPGRVALANRLLPPGRSYVGFAPGSGDPTKRWPLESFIALANSAAAAGHVPVFFLGPSETGMRAVIAEQVPPALFPEEQISASEPQGPLTVIALATRLAAAVSNDSGVGHMFAAANAPLLIFYARHDPAKYAPRVDRLRYLWARDYGGETADLIPLAAAEATLQEMLARDI